MTSSINAIILKKIQYYKTRFLCALYFTKCENNRWRIKQKCQNYGCQNSTLQFSRPTVSACTLQSLSLLYFRKTKSVSMRFERRARCGLVNIRALLNTRSAGALVADTANAFTAPSCNVTAALATGAPRTPNMIAVCHACYHRAPDNGEIQLQL